MKKAILLATGIIGAIGVALLIGKKQKKNDPKTEISDAIKETVDAVTDAVTEIVED